jgi:hypothetical protein
MWKQLLCISPLCRSSRLHLRLQKCREEILRGGQPCGQRTKTSQNLILLCALLLCLRNRLYLTEKYCLDCIIFVRLQKICQITSAHSVHCWRLKMPTVLMSLFFGESKVLKVVLKTLHYNDLVLLLHVCVKYFTFEIGIIRQIFQRCTLGSCYWPHN